ncbi:MAG: hypothetical protein ACI35Z_15805 [Sphingobacterium hotanense]|uniref:hypothetical protein n=1 Tax=Sphingobacterium hotanense TaxID=649196 RepID=UPI0011F30557|nr:hypothetical protein [Sphingobacterium hotanense]
MKPIYTYFITIAILLLLIGFFSVAPDSSFIIEPRVGWVLAVPLKETVFALAFFAVLFSVLYRYTEHLLYSHRWSIMHFICFVCLALNFYTWNALSNRFVMRFEELKENAQQVKQLGEMFMRVEGFYSISFFVLILMQGLYLLNLSVGMIYQKRGDLS